MPDLQDLIDAGVVGGAALGRVMDRAGPAVKDFFTGPMYSTPEADPLNRLQKQAETLRGQILDMPRQIAEHPEDIVGPAELGMAARFPAGHFLPGGEGHGLLTKLLSENKTQQEIASEMGINPSYVNKLISRFGLTYEPDAAKQYPRRLTEDDARQIKTMRNRGMTWSEIADETGKSVGAVFNHGLNLNK